MELYTFKAIGTHWSIRVDGAPFVDRDRTLVTKWLFDFEKRFSRFLPDSEVNAFASSVKGTYEISDEFSVLLRAASHLRELTSGGYDPVVAGLLERAGYDRSYRLTPSSEVEKFILPHWEMKDNKLVIDGPITFDLGGIGKGYAIDRVSEILSNVGYRFYLVEGGGDMYGTCKADGSGWNAAIEWPGKSDIAAGTVILQNAGLAVSDSFKRRWGSWHHVVDPNTRRPVEHIVGCAALAPSAWKADQMTSGLFLADETQYDALAKAFDAKYLIFSDIGLVRASVDWEGELFTEIH